MPVAAPDLVATTLRNLWIPSWRFCVLAFWRLPWEAVQDNSGNFKAFTFLEGFSTGYPNPKSESV
jgi:hypothetical protein